MRFLIVSNLFPPSFIGGYEIGASWVAQALRKAGHQIAVLTCSEVYLGKGDRCESLIHAEPPAEVDAWIDAGACFYGIDVLDGLILNKAGENFEPAKQAFRRHIAGFSARRAARQRAILDFAPDAVLVFNPACILDPVLNELSQLPSLVARPILGYISDDWRIAWDKSHPLIFVRRFFESHEKLHRSQLSDIQSTLVDDCREWQQQGILDFSSPPRFDHLFFCSRTLQRRYEDEMPGCAAGSVLPWGLPQIEAYPEVKNHSAGVTEPLTLGYSGQLEAHKGLYDLLLALLHCKRAHRLIVCGDANTTYAKFCRAFVENSELKGRVEFLGRIPPEAVWPTLSQRASVYILPSRYIPGQFMEPFSISLLQAMAAGFTVIASDSGGSKEAIKPGINGLLFPANNADALAKAIESLADAPADSAQLARAARNSARELYSIERMAAGIVAATLSVAKTMNTNAESRQMPHERCPAFYLVHNANRDPANSGCVRVARRLAHELQLDIRPWFVRWRDDLQAPVFLTEGEADYLGRFNGPSQSDVLAPGRVEGVERPLHQSKSVGGLTGAWIVLPELIDAKMLLDVIRYAKAQRMKTAAIFYDAIPLLRPDLCSEEIRSNHAAYMDALAKCDLVLPISRFSATCLTQHWSERQVPPASVIPLLLPGEFKGVKSERVETSDVMEILCVSTLEPRKNHRRLLAAMERVSQIAPQIRWKLNLVGNSYAGALEITELVEAAQKKDSRIVWHRIVDDATLGELYAKAAFTIYPSIIEGYGLPIVESVWYGCPCICSNSGVMAELASDGGCITVDVEDPNAIAEAVIRLCTDSTLRANLGAQARDRLLKTWRQYGQEVATAMQIGLETKAIVVTEKPLPPLDDVLYPTCLHTGGGWQMTQAERGALTTLIYRTQPKVAIEVGTYKGGSLSLLRQFSRVVFSIDIDPEIPSRFGYMENVSFITSPSVESLPILLDELRQADLPVNFVLIDGDHSRAGVANDIRSLLAVRPLDTTYVLMHDSFNPDCRAGILDAEWEKCEYVHSVEIDHVQGTVVDQPGGPFDGQMWGGFALAVLNRSPRKVPLVIQQSGRRAFERCASSNR